MRDIAKILNQSFILPTLTFHNSDEAIQICRVLYEEGIRVLEINLRPKSGIDAIIAVKADLPADAYVGAGGIIDSTLTESAIAVGAAFGGSPGLTSDLGRAARSLRWAFLPGITTISEAMMAHQLGFKIVKFFPAAISGGTDFLRTAEAILPNMTFCPCGGINQSNYVSYLGLPNVKSVIGSWLTPRNSDGRFDHDQIRGLVRSARANLPKFKTVA